MRVADLCRRGVSKSNDDSYSPWGGQKYHIYLSEVAYSINQTTKEEDTQWQNNALSRPNPKN
jgi:hypothetical protein